MKQLFILIGVFFAIVAQGKIVLSDTLNQYNSNHKKEGYWLCYMDSNFKITDSSKAIFVGFDLYDDGNNLTRIGKQYSKKDINKKDSLAFNYKIGKYTILDGKILIYNKQGDLILKEVYSKGHPRQFYAYRDKKFPGCPNTLREIVDYTKKYNNQIGSLYYEFISCDGSGSKKYWQRKEGKKWKLTRVIVE